ncbi:MAG: TRAP transporter TatT component family protein [PVC group bacterium]
MAVSELGDALAAGGDVYASDDDPELVRAASPFSLKLMESLLAEDPEHRELLLAAARGFTQYSYAFVQEEAEETEETDRERSAALRERARRLYLRARDYGLRGLAVGHPGIAEELRREPRASLTRTGTGDVPFLYWTAVSWASAVSLSRDDPDLIGDLPIIDALVERALVLEEDFGAGALHTFLITYDMSGPGGEKERAARARGRFDRAVELSSGEQAAPFVALAEAVAVPAEDREEFRYLLNRALTIDPDEYPERRLANLIYQRRARRLLEREEELFLGP